MESVMGLADGKGQEGYGIMKVTRRGLGDEK